MLFYVYLILIRYCQTAYIYNLLDVYMCMHGTNWMKSEYNMVLSF